MQDTAIALIIIGFIAQLIVLQWVIIKLFLYDSFALNQVELNPKKVSELERIKLSSFALFLLPLIFPLLFTKILDVTNIAITLTFFLSIFFLYYIILNKFIK